MAKKKKSALPKLEVLIILVFFASFIFWAASKCSATKTMYEEQEAADQTEQEENSLAEEPEKVTTTIPETTLPTSSTDEASSPSPASSSSSALPQRQQLSRLYVTIDGLKLRKEPNLESTVIQTFKLFEEVYFMDEVTDFTETINLGTIEANEPWVKVRGKKGHIGWVYGAGVNYYKKKTEGVL